MPAAYCSKVLIVASSTKPSAEPTKPMEQTTFVPSFFSKPPKNTTATSEIQPAMVMT